MEKEKTTKPAAKLGAVPGLRVTSKTDGFRRAGRAWSDKPIEVPLSELSKEQVEMLKTEPHLIVEVIKIDSVSALELLDESNAGGSQ